MLRVLIVAWSSLALGFGQPALIIPHVADGGGWRSTIVIVNEFGVDEAQLSIVFRGGDGLKMALPIQDYGTISSLDVTLVSNRSIYLETAGTQPGVRVGWVQVNQSSGSIPVKGFAIFRQTVAGRPDFEAVSAGMRAAASMVFPFDNTNGLATSFAAVNLGTSACPIGVFPAYDESGNALTSDARVVGNLLANGHTAFVLTERIPELANKRGYLKFNPMFGCGPEGFAMVGLRFNPTGPFTNLAPLSVASPF